MTYKTREVFGVNRDGVHSYIQRRNVDDRFIDALQDNKHIIIYGASKQGKTALVQKHLNPEDYFPVNSTPQMKTADIYASLLRGIGASIMSSSQESSEFGGSVRTKLGLKAMLPFLGGADAELSSELSAKNGQNHSYQYIETNLEVVQDVADLLRQFGFNKWIVLENYHYLPEDTQKALAYDIRAFHDMGFNFIILGVWKERNRLLQFNRDLLDRLIEIPVEPWHYDEFSKVIALGSQLLNISFDGQLVDDIIQSSFGNIGIVQELCKHVCINAGIQNTSEFSLIINCVEYLHQAQQTKLEDYSSSHMRSLECFARSSDRSDGLFMPYYLIAIMCSCDYQHLINGISKTELLAQYNNDKMHAPGKTVRPGDVTYLLNNLSNTQYKAEITPPLFDYDSVGRRLRVIDSTLLFFLNFQDKEALLNDITPYKLGEEVLV